MAKYIHTCPKCNHELKESDEISAGELILQCINCGKYWSIFTSIEYSPSYDLDSDFEEKEVYYYTEHHPNRY